MVRAFMKQRGQVTVEVAVLFGFVVAGLVALALYLQRSVQGGLRSNADSLGGQFSSGEAWTSYTRSASVEDGKAIRSAQYSKACQGVGGTANPGCDPGALNASAPDPNNVPIP